MRIEGRQNPPFVLKIAFVSGIIMAVSGLVDFSHL
jgi:hypothetical protein